MQWRNVGGGRELVFGRSLERGSVEDDLFDVEFDAFRGGGRRGGSLDDGKRGFQTNGGGSVGIDQDFLNGLEREIDEAFQFFTEVECPVILSVREGMLEGRGIATPVRDRVAVNAGLFRGGGQGRAI